MKAEDYGAIAFVFACLALTTVTWWCDREHERIFHTPQKGGAASFELRQTQVRPELPSVQSGE